MTNNDCINLLHRVLIVYLISFMLPFPIFLPFMILGQLPLPEALATPLQGTAAFVNSFP